MRFLPFTRHARGASAVAAALLGLTPAAAAETAYRYDARGRLIGVERGGGHLVSYRYDKANNRTEKTLSQAGATIPAVPAPGAAVAVVPVPGGYRIIPLQH
ncbi:MAG TPA: RHS repeat domain-containing protein [Allosphingosinicella sp.]|nr:RHS repeat domain-containing protein [Allosphingosinicella sp.]